MGFAFGTAVAPRRRVIGLALVLAVGTATAGAAVRTLDRPSPRAVDAGPRSLTPATAPTAGASSAASAAGVPPQPAPFQALPVGPPPTTVPYGIGARVFFGGHGTDLTAAFTGAFPGRALTPAEQQFASVTGAAGYAWTDIVGTGTELPASRAVGATATGDGTDVVGPGTGTVHVVGRLAPDGSYTPFHVSTGGVAGPAVTTGGLVVMPGGGLVYTSAGSFYGAFTGSANIDCGSCEPTAAGARIVLDQWSSAGSPPRHAGTWLWYPPDSIAQLGDGLRAVGQGPGWVGQRLPDGCWRVAPVSAPDRLGARLCSQTTPLLSADGVRAVVVRAGRLLVLDTATGTTLSTASMAPIGGWAPPTTADPSPAHPRYAVPTAWETDDAYLVTARFDDALALVRCSATTGACRRAVWSTVRPGVDRIVTERGPADAE